MWEEGGRENGGDKGWHMQVKPGIVKHPSFQICCWTRKLLLQNSIDLERPAVKFKVKPIVSAIQEPV